MNPGVGWTVYRGDEAASRLGGRTTVNGWRNSRWVLALATGLVLAGCAAGPGTTAADDATPSAPSETSPSPPPSPSTPRSADPTVDPGVTVTTDASEFGPMLFDDRGQAIYLFDREETAEPDCYDECAAAWPPVLTTGPPQASGDVQVDLLGTTHRDDGSLQVTYAGHPLYFYAHEAPRQVLCHDVAEFGGVWLVVTPSGTPAP
jgi:predicted lipoprotein with Yx(FWY)xxD motif